MTGRHLAPLPAAPLARHKGRHRRRRFARPAEPIQAAPVDDFSRVRKPALAPVPAADLSPSLPDYRRPYDSQNGTAA